MSHNNKLMQAIILLFDAVVYIVALLAMIAIFPQFTPASIERHFNIALLLGITCFALFSIAFPVIVDKRKVYAKDIVFRIMAVVVLSQSFFLILWHTITRESANEMAFVILMSALLTVLLAVTRGVERIAIGQFRRLGRNSRSVLFVGSDPSLLKMYREVMLDPMAGYNVQGYYSDEEIADAPQELKRLGTIQDLYDIIDGRVPRTFVIDDMYCSLAHTETQKLRKLMRFCNACVIHFYYIPRIAYTKKMYFKPELIGENVVYTNYHEPLLDMENRVMKRTFDVVCSLIVLLLLVFFLPVIAFIIKRQSPGPIFFSQLRTGMDGRNFICYKFRSMHVNKDSDTLQATKDDPRKFPFGDFMRRSNIDELPQFFNVLKGDMSMVGPRPHMVLHTEMYSKLIGEYMVRHFIKPGITGLAQVTGFRGETKELKQMEGRVQRDIWYMENWSFWLDIKICFLTIWQIIKKDDKAY